MAKDKNRGDAARAGNPKERDTSIDATSGAESDSELDIHALLRKYMPDYDADDLDSNDNAEEKIYNLNGQRVTRENMHRGIYIINGKKVIVK